MKDLEDTNFAFEDVLQAINTKYPTTSYDILEYRLEPIKEVTGLLGEHAILTVSLKNPLSGIQEEDSFFVKFFPKNKSVADFASGIGAFTKEFFVYDLLKRYQNAGIKVDTCAPVCYAKKPENYLILDNLYSQGYKKVNKNEPLEYQTVLVVLQSLAKLHAASFIYEEQITKEVGTKYTLWDEFEEKFEETFYNDRKDFANAAGLQASLKGLLKEIEIFKLDGKLRSEKNFQTVAETIFQRIYELVKPSDRFRNCLCHGDLWAANFLIKYDENGRPKDCKFVDFQCGRYVPPAHDVLSTIYLTTSTEFRRKYMYQVIGMYYSYLEKHLKSAGLEARKIISFTDFMESCEEQKLFAILQAATYFPLILIDDEQIGQCFSDPLIFEKGLLEDRSYLVLKHMKTDPIYEKRVKESVMDLKEYCDNHYL